MGTVYPLLISIPHSGSIIPPEVAEMVRITGKDIFYDGDTLTREIYDFGKSANAVIKTPIARAIVDVNRAYDDRPPENPDGVVKTVTTDGTPVYREGMFPDDDLVEDLLQSTIFRITNGWGISLKAAALDWLLTATACLSIHR